MHVSNTLDDYAAHEYAAGRSPHTIALRLVYLRQLADALDGAPVTTTAVVTWLAGQRRWSAQTRASAASSVRSWLRWADDPSLPDPESIPVATVHVQRRHRTVPDGSILSAVDAASDATALMILLAREAGLRRGEIAQVHAGDVQPCGTRLLVHGKGGKDRVVPLTPLLAAAIARRIESHPGYLFPGPDGGHIAGQSVYGRIRRAVHVNPHSLRHTFATHCYELNGHDLRAVQELLGHESVVTTQRYVGVQCRQLRETVESASLIPHPRMNGESNVGTH